MSSRVGTSYTSPTTIIYLPNERKKEKNSADDVTRETMHKMGHSANYRLSHRNTAFSFYIRIEI